MEVLEKLKYGTMIKENCNQSRHLSILSRGQLTMPPDRVKLPISIKVSKDNITDAKESALRRSEYIISTLKRNDLNVG
jgi:uncharacterized protein YggE